MGSLFGSQPKVIPEFTGLQVNTSVQVLPIPIIYGSPRVSINLIYYNGFNSQLVSTGGGKGVLSGGKGQKQVEYFATILMAIGEGPIANVKIIYQDQNVWTPATYPTNGSEFFDGDPGQPPWSYIVDNWPIDARGYTWTSYYAFSNAQLDASATVPQINLVLEGFFTGSSPLNYSTVEITTGQYDPNGNPVSFIGDILLGNADADPAECIIDFLTSPIHGATFPAQFLDIASLRTSPDGFNPDVGDAALSTYCQAVGLAWSCVLNNVESANSILERWCKNLNVAPLWNGATLRFIPYWDQFASGNPGWSDNTSTYYPDPIPMKYFSPYITPVVTITADQILQSENKDEDPITFSRKDPQEVYNTVRLDFSDRTNFFNDNACEVKDEAHIELYGPRIDNIGTGDEFSLLTYANMSATMQLRRNIAIMLTYTWKMGPLWGWLDPMTIVAIPDPTNYSSYITVRVISVEDDEDENVTITAEEFPIGAQSPSTIPASTTTPPNQGALNVPSSPTYPPVMFFPTTDMLTATGFAVPQWILGAVGGGEGAYAGVLDPNWGGCNIWVSLDNVNYQLIGTLTGPSTVGSLSQNVAGYGGVNPDNTDAIYVDVNQSNGVLATVSDAAAAAGHSICIMQDVSGFEIFAYTTATLIGPFTYQLTGLYRGLYGTTSRLFGSGSQFLYVGSTANIFEIALPPGYIGMNFWVKPQAFNSLRNYVQELSDTAAYEMNAYGPTPPPLIPPPMRMPLVRRIVNQTPLRMPRRRPMM